MSVSFNTIPGGIRVPLFYAEMDNSAAATPTMWLTCEGKALLLPFTRYDLSFLRLCFLGNKSHEVSTLKSFTKAGRFSIWTMRV